MEIANRKREDDGGANGKRRKPSEDDHGVRERMAPPHPLADEEVEEFFAILKRTQVAVNYFRRRDGVRSTDGDLTSIPPWRPTFRQEDFDGVNKEPVGSPGVGLDLNSEPACDVWDSR
ncbi:protein nim1-interacting 2 [Phtheirospermum japonicum]|uniref:Protein nim1-interacting 2 n=1 Tax=Phtheirospermum japonicum TaxID=374723 RepID=A0A830BCJ6_9LAMI|nr:protein nim1-interacting 2 [Phtheirospermum japonicum]